MIIKATFEQMQKMAAAAINASQPVGMGFLHYKVDDKIRPEEILIGSRGISLDYVGGRMVKFYARYVDVDTWDVPDEISYDYQSWKSTYSSYQDLFDKVAK